MIARIWRGWVRSERAAEYIGIVERTGIAGYRRTPGNLGAQILTRDVGGGRTEMITLSWWTSLKDIEAFAGEDIETAKYYPEDDDFLLDRRSTVEHFEVAPPGTGQTQPIPFGDDPSG
jgi:heme-degrading monooxygenase HmoA